jgi:hypothetical protein
MTYIVKQFSILTVLILLIFSCNRREDHLEIFGYSVIQKIEHYRKSNGFLPEKLTEIEIKETEEGPLYYDKIDDLNYSLSFGTTLGESKIYYSDSKKWEKHYR